MTAECADCAAAIAQSWPGFSAGCKVCAARALASIFLAKGERGRRYRRALEQVGVTDAEVQAAHERRNTPTKEAPSL